MGQNNHSGHWGITPPPPSKTPPSYFLPNLPKISKLSKPLFLGNPAPVFWFFTIPLLKVRSFSDAQKY